MTTDIEEAVKAAIAQAAPAAVDPAPAAVPPVAFTVPARVAGNICRMLEKTPVTGMEAVAWVEAFQLMQQLSLQAQGPGVPFQGLGK